MTKEIPSVLFPRLEGDCMETHIFMSKNDDFAEMDTTYMPDYNKAKKAKWTVIKNYINAEGRIVGGRLQAPRNSVSIRTVNKTGQARKELTEAQKKAAAERLNKAKSKK